MKAGVAGLVSSNRAKEDAGFIRKESRVTHGRGRKKSTEKVVQKPGGTPGRSYCLGKALGSGKNKILVKVQSLVSADGGDGLEGATIKESSGNF